MTTFFVQKTVETEGFEKHFDQTSFATYELAKAKLQEMLVLAADYAGEYVRDTEFSVHYYEALEIVKFTFDEDGEIEDHESLDSIMVYAESLMDKNNYRGEYANEYWGVGKYDGTELVYDFFCPEDKINPEYSQIKYSQLDKWYNYKR